MIQIWLKRESRVTRAYSNRTNVLETHSDPNTNKIARKSYAYLKYANFIYVLNKYGNHSGTKIAIVLKTNGNHSRAKIERKSYAYLKRTTFIRVLKIWENWTSQDDLSVRYFFNFFFWRTVYSALKPKKNSWISLKDCLVGLQ